MYCSSCGVAVAPGLSYCNFCGAKLNVAKADNLSKSSEVKPELLIRAMVSLFVLGLFSITVLMGVMKAILRLDIGQILPFALVSFLLMILIEGIFIRLLFRRHRSAEETDATALSKAHATKELEATQARALPEPLSEPASVTEHTTRAFEPLYNERPSK
jgi:hypothetical protein